MQFLALHASLYTFIVCSISHSCCLWLNCLECSSYLQCSHSRKHVPVWSFEGKQDKYINTVYINKWQIQQNTSRWNLVQNIYTIWFLFVGVLPTPVWLVHPPFSKRCKHTICHPNLHYSTPHLLFTWSTSRPRRMGAAVNCGGSSRNHSPACLRRTHFIFHHNIYIRISAPAPDRYHM